jgi:hypothetical protein
MSVVSYTVDNLIQATEGLVTDSSYALEAGNSVVRGEVLKRGTTGLVKLAATNDAPYTIALQTVDATSGAKPLVYALEGPFTAASMSTNSIGTVATFKDGLRDAGLLVF